MLLYVRLRNRNVDPSSLRRAGPTIARMMPRTAFTSQDTSWSCNSDSSFWSYLDKSQPFADSDGYRCYR